MNVTISNLWARATGGIVTAGVLRTSAWGFADQAVASGSNFLTMVIAARTLGPESFGLFAIMHVILLSCHQLHSALITQPHNLLGARAANQRDYAEYTGSTLVMQSALSGGLACVALVTGIIAALSRFDTVGPLVVSLGFAIVAWQTQEFVRRVLYTEGRIPHAFANDIITYGSQVTLVVVLALAGELTGPRVLLAIGAGSAAGALVGLFRIRSSLAFARPWSALKQNWDVGKWLAASGATTRATDFATAAIIPAMIGVGAYGGYRAFHQLAMASNLFLQAMSGLVRPAFGRRARSGKQQVSEALRPLVILGAGATLLFAIALIIAREPLTDLLFGRQYVEYAAMVFLVATIPLWSLLRSVFGIALVAMQRGSDLFVSGVVCSIVGIGAGSIALLMIGAPAAAAIPVTASACKAVWLALRWRQL